MAQQTQSGGVDRFGEDRLDNLGGYAPDDVIAAVDAGLGSGPSAVSYDELYLRWERQNWRTEELDFSQDERDWNERLSDGERRQLLWFMALFFHGEERVAVELAPFIDAAPTVEQQVFLTTQVVDEARHARFFDRFYRDALGFDQPGMTERMEAVRDQLSDGFKDLFGPILNDVTTRMRRGDHSTETFVRGVVTYHLTIEGVVALTGQRHVLQFFRKRDLMPGFRNGFTAVARDESRHVNFGMKVLKEAVAADPSLIEAIHDQIAIAMPAASRIFDPPPGDRGRAELLGFTVGDLYAYGFRTLRKRLGSINVPEPFRWNELAA